METDSIDRHGGRSCFLLFVLMLTGLTLSGCDAIPKDPEGTYERVEGGVLRAGIVQNHPWITKADTVDPEGIEIELIRKIADRLGAQIEWVPGGSAELLEELEEYNLDIVGGGFTESNPWNQRVATSHPFLVDSIEGDSYILFLPPGENRWIMEVGRIIHSLPEPDSPTR